MLAGTDIRGNFIFGVKLDPRAKFTDVLFMSSWHSYISKFVWVSPLDSPLGGRQLYSPLGVTICNDANDIDEHKLMLLFTYTPHGEKGTIFLKSPGGKRTICNLQLTKDFEFVRWFPLYIEELIFVLVYYKEMKIEVKHRDQNDCN